MPVRRATSSTAPTEGALLSLNVRLVCLPSLRMARKVVFDGKTVELERLVAPTGCMRESTHDRGAWRAILAPLFRCSTDQVYRRCIRVQETERHPNRDVERGARRPRCTRQQERVEPADRSGHPLQCSSVDKGLAHGEAEQRLRTVGRNAIGGMHARLSYHRGGVEESADWFKRRAHASCRVSPIAGTAFAIRR
jgi:hypothetical protein